jgi:2-hydroxy-3-oxopropionate reductase
MTNIAFIGTGIMGKPMAQHLARGGHRVLTFSRRNPSIDGCAAASSIVDATSRSDVVILMLPDTPDVEAVLFGEGGVASEGQDRRRHVVHLADRDEEVCGARARAWR